MTNGHPSPPRVRAKTQEEKDRDARRARLVEFVRQARQRISNREAGETISPYDLMSEVLFNVVSDALFKELNAPDFAVDLRRRGYALVPAFPFQDIPDPPADWAERALELYATEGHVVDALGLVDDLWQEAYIAGAQAERARVAGEATS